MSYSRWKDDGFWPLFRDALLEQHPSLTEEGLGKAREFNFQRYYFQGIGRYELEEAYERGSPISKCWRICCPRPALHGGNPTSIDAGIYGFIANIYFYPIDTPLRQFVTAHDKIVRHCEAMHAGVAAPHDRKG